MNMPLTKRVGKTSHPYPQRYLLPGYYCSNLTLKPLTGVRANIVHSLTYYAIPPKIDEKIDSIPTDAYFQTLLKPQKESLSFSVYSLKQMTAAGTISAETAWTLFYWELNRLPAVTENNFETMRKQFFTEVANQTEYQGPELLQFEFYMRAGEAGLAQFERYYKWADSIMLENVPNYLREEYQKALWLEMRIIEGAFGFGSLTKDIDNFGLQARAAYFSSILFKLFAAVDLFNEFVGGVYTPKGQAIDAMLKAEIGHWLADRVILSPYSPIGELMDRTSALGFTPAVNDGYLLAHEQRSPMQRVFWEGGFFITSAKDAFPAYPYIFPNIPRNDEDDHIKAEYIEQKIRQKIICALQEKTLSPSQAYQAYRNIALYLAVATFPGEILSQILLRLEALDLKDQNHCLMPEIAARIIRVNALTSGQEFDRLKGFLS